jgi:L-alanine-DL-glutamate epimerase-like enolase superfamily enzyme
MLELIEAVPVYASGIPAAAPGSGAAGLAGVTELAHGYAGRGFQAAKVAIGNDPATDLASVEVVRLAVGSAPGLGTTIDETAVRSRTAR